MADVSPRAGADSGDRAQLLLVSALALAVLFVSLAMLLNTVIYTGNLATRSVGADSATVVDYQQSSVDAAESALSRANDENNSNYSTVGAAFEASVETWDAVAGRHRAVDGDAASVTVESVNNGSTVRQTNASRELTNEPGSADWSIPTGGEYRAFSMSLDNTSLGPHAGGVLADFTDDDRFHVEATTAGGDTYSTFVTRGIAPGTVEVTTFGPGWSSSCSMSDPGSTVEVDVTAGTLEGEDCGALAALSGENVTEVGYGDGDDVTGTYSLVVDREDVGDVADVADNPSSEPYWTPALYDARVNVTYRSPNAFYDASVRVIPDEN